MKTIRKVGIFVASFVASMAGVALLSPARSIVAASSDLSIPKGFADPVSIDVSANNEALNHWQYYISNTLDDEGNYRGDSVYEDKNVHFKATPHGRTGKAMWIEKKESRGTFTAYSYAIDVASNQNYAISAYVKNVCEANSDNNVSFMVKELNESGAKTSTNDEFALLTAVSGVTDGWSKAQFSFKTSAEGKRIILKIQVKGKGDFYIDDIAIQTATASLNTISYRLQSVGEAAEGATDDLSYQDGGGFTQNSMKAMKSLTSANISTDSSDGDGASLFLKDGQIFKTNFSSLSPEKTYRFSFKYKHLKIGSRNTLSIRFDYVDLTGKRQYYFDVANGSQTEWLTFSQDIKGAGSLNSNAVSIAASANYLIDELSLTSLDESDPMQYIANGSFSGAYTEGYNMGLANSNIAKQADGTSVFVLGNFTYNETLGQRGYIEYTPSGLTAGKEYTLNFDYRYSGPTWMNSVLLYRGSEEAFSIAGQDLPDAWTTGSYKFTATESDKFTFYGPSAYFWTNYYRNIKVVDAESNQYNPNVDLKTPDTILGENVFPYGTFEGNTEYVPNDWNFQGDGNIYGLVFDTRFEEGVGSDTKPDWMICLNGSKEAPASAISKDIPVSKKTLAIALSMCNGKKNDLGVFALVGDKEIALDENGFLELPDGTSSIKLKFTAEKYLAFKKLYLLSHTHITPSSSDITTVEATCTEAGGKTFHCADCDKTVYLEKTEKLDHDFEHLHKDATCLEGYDKDVCKRCHQEFNVTILPGDSSKHQYKETILKEATCVKNGMKQEICQICGKEKEATIIKATGKHNYENGVCTMCGAADPDYVEPSKPTNPNNEGNDSAVLWTVLGISGGVIVIGVVTALIILNKGKKKKAN